MFVNKLFPHSARKVIESLIEMKITGDASISCFPDFDHNKLIIVWIVC